MSPHVLQQCGQHELDVTATGAGRPYPMAALAHSGRVDVVLMLGFHPTQCINLMHASSSIL